MNAADVLPSWHPWLAELRALLRARWRRACHHPGEALFQLVAWSVLLLLLAWAWRHVDGDHAGVVIHLLLQEPLVPLALCAVLGYGTASGAGKAVAAEWRDGWWGAVPVAAAAQRRSQRLVAALAVVLMAAVLALVLLALAAVADHWRTWLVPALRSVGVGLPLGAVPALWRSPRAFAAEAPRMRARAADRPLFRLPWLERGAQPQLAAWQRREALRVWRHGARVWPLLALGLLVPRDVLGWSLLGLLLVGLSLVWFGLVLRASPDVIARGDALLRATPQRFGAYCRATLGYPLWACACASALTAVGLLLQRASAVAVLACAALLAVLLSMQLVLAWRHRRAPWRARLRFGVDVAVLAAVAWSLPLALPLAWIGLLSFHFHKARHLP